MVQTDYMLHPLGRRLMISFLVLIFVLIFIAAPLWLIPINALIHLFSSFTITPSVFVRGAGGLFLSILITALLVERIFEYIGWYKLELLDDKELIIHYRNGMFKPYNTLHCSMRKTKIITVERLYWIIPGEYDFTVVLQPPDELDGVSFYEQFEEIVEENYFKARKQLEDQTIKDFKYHFMLLRGQIKKFHTEEFIQVSGLREIHMDDPNYEISAAPEEEFKEISNLMEYAENVELMQ